jgi:hypothetical protein
MSRQELRHNHASKLEVKNSPEVFNFKRKRRKQKIKTVVVTKSTAMALPMLLMIGLMGTVAVLLLSSLLENNKELGATIGISALGALLVANQTSNKLLATAVWFVITAGALLFAIIAVSSQNRLPLY